MHVGKDFDIPDEFYSIDFIGFCLNTFKEMLPIQKWLSQLTKRV
jgi:hypothetical protein